MELRYLFTRGAVTGQNPEFLVGRQELVSDLANRLAEDRLSGVIYGTRGVGKTSLAWQVATVLAGINPRFRKEDVVKLRRPPEFEIVFHKCSRFVDTVGDLLLEIVLTKTSDFSFQEVLSPYYDEGDNGKSITRKITGGFPKLLEMSEDERTKAWSALDEARTHFKNEADKIALFNELMFSISKRIGGKRILLVVDEFDRPRDFRGGIRLENSAKKDVEGVGELIKDTDIAQFLLVGIAENVSEILKDHKSAARKMPGCVVSAPLMSDHEIGEIFHRAVRESKGALTVAPVFIQQVVRYASGLPWIAQHIGYEAVREASGPVTLDGSHFEPALKKTVESFAEDADVSESVEFLEQANRTDLEILGVIWDHTRGEEEHEVRRAVPQRFKQNFDAALRRLIGTDILVRKGSRLVFKDPIVRVFSRKYIDDARS
ncbi:MAG: hypothetical protein ACKVOB_09700 [Sphingomonas sp.]